jgi:hypothetical protein
MLVITLFIQLQPVSSAILCDVAHQMFSSPAETRAFRVDCCCYRLLGGDRSCRLTRCVPSVTAATSTRASTRWGGQGGAYNGKLKCHAGIMSAVTNLLSPVISVVHVFLPAI